MKNFFNAALMMSSLGIAMNVSAEGQEKVTVDAVAGRVGKAGRIVEDGGLVTLGAGVSVGLTLSSGKKTPVTLALGFFPLWGAFVGGQLAAYGATTQYFAIGKISVSKADTRQKIIAGLRATKLAPESTRNELSDLVLSLNAQDAASIAENAYDANAIEAATFLLDLSAKAKAMTAEHGGCRSISLQEARSLVQATIPASKQCTPAQLEEHLRIGYNMLAMNNVYISDLLAE